MKYLILTLLVFSSHFATASKEVNTVQAIHNSAPGLTYHGVATGSGQINNSGEFPCTLLYKDKNSKVQLTLVVKNKVTEFEFENILTPYENPENDEVLFLDYNEQKSTFLYSYDYGHMTNQYTGEHSYRISFQKKSENSFTISYFHSWADDDGFVGNEHYQCSLSN